MNYQVVYILVLTSVLTFSCNRSQETTTHQEVEVSNEEVFRVVKSEEVKDILKDQDVVILDVRTPQEYSSGHVKGAKNIDFYAPDFASQVGQLDKNKTYVVYCAVGGRSRQAMQMMRKLNFHKVYDAGEGFQALKRNGVDVE